MSTLVEDVKKTYHLSVSLDYAERALASNPTMSSSDLYRRVLNDNLKTANDSSALPFGIASQVSATLPNSVVLQINSSRDATQPLRPCADATEDETILNSALQKVTSRRLLRLVLTDGCVEIPAVELSTLSVFRGLPIPGEKLLISSGTEVRNGAIIMTEGNTKLLGGEVSQLKQEFIAHRRRAESGFQSAAGLDGAPQFAPLQIGHRYNRNEYKPNDAPMAGGRGGGTFAGRGAQPAARGASRGSNPYNNRGGGGGNAGRGGHSFRGRGGDNYRPHRGGGERGQGRGSFRGGFPGASRGGVRQMDPNAEHITPPAYNYDTFPSLS